MNSVILINKEKGITSAKVVSKLKKKFKLKKIGHAGTLDPDAEGLLVCLTNKATKFASKLQSGIKVYSGVIRFGISTDTDDIFGNITETYKNIPKFEEILKVSKKLIGVQRQVPPIYSAVKVAGKRSYDLARKGLVPELKAKDVNVYRFDLRPINDTDVAYEIECSSGTYVRSLARDLGIKLNCGAVTVSINRVFSSPFSVSEAKSIDEVKEKDFLSWDLIFRNNKRIFLSESVVGGLKQGDKRVFSRPDFPSVKNFSKDYVLYCNNLDKIPQGLLKVHEGNWIIAHNM